MQAASSTAARFRKLAADLRARGEAEENRERLENTHKRREEAAAMRKRAREQQRLADTLERLAAEQEAGRSPHLAGIRSVTHLEALDGVLRSALRRQEDAQDTRPGYSGHRLGSRKPLELHDLDLAFVRVPYPRIRAEHLLAALPGQSAPSAAGRAALASLLQQAKRAKPDDIIVVSVPAELAELRHLSKHKENHFTLGDAVTAYDRIAVMGLADDAKLKAAIGEYVGCCRGEARKASPLEVAKQAVAGLKIPGYVPTPAPAADRLVLLAGIPPNARVLEPEAGKGDLVDAILRSVPSAVVEVIERSHELRQLLELQGRKLVGDDMLAYQGGPYDRVVMNPPFEDGQDIVHVRHAYELLRPGGRLAAIVSEGPFFRQDARSQAFRAWLEELGAHVEKLPEHSFRTSTYSTDVAASIVIIDKPGNLTPAATRAAGRADYQERRERRIEGLGQRAASKRDEANALWDRAHKRLEHVPMGQPILVGHHSEARHRRDIERAHADTRRSIDTDRAATELAHRAAAAATSTAISSDDPDSIAKLTAKLQQLETDRARWKQINQAVRKKDPKAALAALALDAATIERLLTPNFAKRVGIPDYKITNSGAEVRRLKTRLAELVKRAETEAPADHERGEFRATWDGEENRVAVYSPYVPDKAAREKKAAKMRAEGFNWSPTNTRWQRQASMRAWHAAVQLVDAMAAAAAVATPKTEASRPMPPTLTHGDLIRGAFAEPATVEEALPLLLAYLRAVGDELPYVAPHATLSKDRLLKDALRSGWVSSMVAELTARGILVERHDGKLAVPATHREHARARSAREMMLEAVGAAPGTEEDMMRATDGPDPARVMVLLAKAYQDARWLPWGPQPLDAADSNWWRAERLAWSNALGTDDPSNKALKFLLLPADKRRALVESGKSPAVADAALGRVIAAAGAAGFHVEPQLEATQAVDPMWLARLQRLRELTVGDRKPDKASQLQTAAAKLSSLIQALDDQQQREFWVKGRRWLVLVDVDGFATMAADGGAMKTWPNAEAAAVEVARLVGPELTPELADRWHTSAPQSTRTNAETTEPSDFVRRVQASALTAASEPPGIDPEAAARQAIAKLDPPPPAHLRGDLEMFWNQAYQAARLWFGSGATKRPSSRTDLLLWDKVRAAALKAGRTKPPPDFKDAAQTVKALGASGRKFVDLWIRYLAQSITETRITGGRAEPAAPAPDLEKRVPSERTLRRQREAREAEEEAAALAAEMEQHTGIGDGTRTVFAANGPPPSKPRAKGKARSAKAIKDQERKAATKSREQARKLAAKARVDAKALKERDRSAATKARVAAKAAETKLAGKLKALRPSRPSPARLLDLVKPPADRFELVDHDARATLLAGSSPSAHHGVWIFGQAKDLDKLGRQLERGGGVAVRQEDLLTVTKRSSLQHFTPTESDLRVSLAKGRDFLLLVRRPDPRKAAQVFQRHKNKVDAPSCAATVRARAADRELRAAQRDFIGAERRHARATEKLKKARAARGRKGQRHAQS